MKCFSEIEHCESYNNDIGNCIRCETGYKVKKDDYTCERGSEGCKVYDFDQNICTECEYNYRLSSRNKLCYKKIENCQNYGNDELCSQCITGYAFEGNDKNNCKEKSLFIDGYFTKNNEISYFKCDDINNGGVDYCINCDYNNEVICNRCSNDYILKDQETNKCYLKSNYSNNQYYKVDDYHINTCSITKENCDECVKTSEESELNCTKCIDGFRLSKNVCLQIIENCQIYRDDDLFQLCKTGFAFEGENREICKNKNEFIDYYSKDDEISYLKCDDLDNEGIENCKTCEYNSDKNKVICTKCKSGFVIKDKETDKCYSNDDYINNKEYYYEDEYHVRKCSIRIENCIECEKLDGKLNCNLCDNNYVLINDEIKNCKSNDQISFDEYFLENNIYQSCLFHNSIENCKKCQNKDSCNLCKEKYTFINDDKILCKNIEELGKQYIVDKNDASIYRKCSELMENCDTCKSENLCLTCLNEFGLYNDRKTCINITE